MHVPLRGSAINQNNDNDNDNDNDNNMELIIGLVIVSLLIAYAIHANDEHAKSEDEAVDVIGGGIVVFFVLVWVVVIFAVIFS